MSSEDLLNQPIPDDADISSETASALMDFFGQEAPQGTDGTDLPSEVVGQNAQGPNAGEPTPKAKSPEPASSKSLDDQLEEAQAQLADLEDSPQERYKNLLKSENISEVEARKIIDRIVVDLKPYAEKIPMTDTKYVVLRTRTQADQDRLNEVLESMQPKYRMTITSEIAKQNLVSSLVRYGDVTFERDDDGIRNTVKWLATIPQPVFVLLQNKLYEFDRKIDVVFQEGYIENFYPTPS